MSAAYEEILHQPQAWRATHAAAPLQWERLRGGLPSGPETQYLFVGCGTSLYLAQSAARCFQELTGRTCIAAPGSEVFLSPSGWLSERAPTVAFVISRSGTTTEAVMAAEYLLAHYANVTVVGLTCNEGTALAEVAGRAIVLPHASERSVVMTQSFTSMLLALQEIAVREARADGADPSGLASQLGTVGDAADELLDAYEAFGRQLGEDLALERFVFLGLGPLYGAAQEANLKLKEMTQTPCEAYSPLEFRHGPISTVREGTAVVLLEGAREREYVGALEADVQRLGARVATIGPYASERAEHALRLPDGLDDVPRTVLYLPPLQLLAYRRALALGLDPDRPRNLDQVVVLGPRAEG